MLGVLLCVKSEVNIMSDGTSVGKISLEVDLQGDMKQQISDMANSLGTSLKSSLEKATSGMLSGLEKVIDSAMKNINSSISEGLEKMKTQMDGFIKSIQAMTSKIKVPTKMPVPTNMVPAMNPVIPSVNTRGPPVAGIDYAATQEEIYAVTAAIESTEKKIDLLSDKYRRLKKEADDTFNPVLKNKLQLQVVNLELAIDNLNNKTSKYRTRLSELNAKMNGTAQTTSKLGASVKAATNKIKQSTKAINNSVGPVGKTADVIGGKFDKMGRMINSALKRVLIMATLYKVIRGFMSYMNSALATNQQFSNSLAIVKSNLQVAFIPIFNAILPALNTMMSALARVTTYIASFVSVIGGSTFKASTASAKALNKQKAAISGVGAATKKTANEMKKALAGFDEITNLNTPEAPDAGGGGGSGASGTAPIVSPGIDMSKFEAGLRSFLDKLDPYLEPARQALDRLKEAFEPLKQNLFDGLKWLMDEVLIPLGKWVLKDVVPQFIDMLSASIKILNAAVEVLKPIFKWLWDNVLKPLAEYTGGIIVAVLDGIVEELETLATQITDTWEHVKEVWKATRQFLIDTWETIKTKAREIWGNIVSTIKNAFNGIKEWFSGVFTGAWNGIKRAFSGVGSFFSGIWTTIKNTFTTIGHVIGTGIGNAFKTVVNSIIRFAENTINGFIRAINRAISLINKIPGVNISKLSTLSIPKLATGGMIDQPTLAMVGEAGKEAVLPIDKDRGAMKQIADMLADKMGSAGGNPTGDVIIQIDGSEIGRVSKHYINRERRIYGKPII